MKIFFGALLFLLLASATAFGQPGSPIFLGPVINFLPPALDASGRTVAFGSTVTAQGGVQDTIDLHVGNARLAPGVTSVGITADGSRAIFTDTVKEGEGVGIADTSSGTVRRLQLDTQGCIQPLALCVSCFFACVVTPHATVDGSKVLYAVRRQQPFFVVNADGTGLKQLPVYSGALAPSPQRVISANGLAVFTSAAPFGPTFAASATDVYSMNLDGANIRNLTNFGINSSIFASNATISADGNTVVFESNYNGKSSTSNQTQIWAVQSDGSALRQLTFGADSASNPSLSADGKTGAFLQAGLIGVLQPFGVPQSKGLQTSLAPLRYSVPLSPVISDDGRHVAFLIGPSPNFAGAVYQVDIDGSNLHAVYAPRAISPRGVVSAAGFAQPPSPGGLVSVYGINFSGDSITTANSFPLPTTLAGVSLRVNAAEQPMLMVSPWQITAQLSQQALAESTKFQVASQDGVVTPPETVDVAEAAPALFVAQVQRGQTVVTQAAAFHAGTAVLADDDHPAQLGETLELYGTGLGVTDPPVAAGQPSPANPLARAMVTPRVLIDNIESKVLFAGLTPGLAGVYQINIVMPGGLRSGRHSVALQIGTQNPSASGEIAVRNP